MSYISIGKILKPQGIKGELKVKPLLDDLNIIANVKDFVINNKTYTLKSLSFREGFIYICFNEIQQRNDAELLRGKHLLINREIATKTLKDGDYFMDDIIGLTVEDELGKIYGVVEDIQNFGSKDVYYINNGKKEILFPCIDGLVTDVDLKEKKLIVNSKIMEQVIVEWK